MASASVIDILEPAGVGAHATRATLSRMTKRGLLRRVPSGRQAYFGLTEFGRRTVLEGRHRAQVADVVASRWDGRWTLVAFSLPEASHRERHGLRSRLTWAGFGMVQAGMWAAPRDIDVVGLLADLDGFARRQRVPRRAGGPDAGRDARALGVRPGTRWPRGTTRSWRGGRRSPDMRGRRRGPAHGAGPAQRRLAPRAAGRPASAAGVPAGSMAGPCGRRLPAPRARGQAAAPRRA